MSGQAETVVKCPCSICTPDIDDGTQRRYSYKSKPPPLEYVSGILRCLSLSDAHHPTFAPANLESWLMLGLGAKPLPACPVPNGPIAETLRSLIDRSIADALHWSVAAVALAAPVTVAVAFEVLLAGAGELGPP
jgi:hypothetical protein